MTVPELWKTFKQIGKVSDIIVPNKKDRFGKTFSFLSAKNHKEAVEILKKAGQITFHGDHIKMDWARKSNQQSPKNQNNSTGVKNNKYQPQPPYDSARRSSHANKKEQPLEHMTEKCGVTSGVPLVLGTINQEYTVLIQMEDNWKELVDLSYTTDTFEDLKLDSMKEIFCNIGWNFIKVTKLRKSCFLLTLEDREVRELIIWDDLKLWVKSYSKTSLSDLVVTRIAWLKVIGAPFMIVSKHVWETLVSPVGSLVGVISTSDEITQLPNLNICISTNRGEEIKLSRQINVDGHIFKVSLLEEHRNFNYHHLMGHEQQRNKVNSWIYSTLYSEKDQSWNNQSKGTSVTGKGNISRGIKFSQ